MKWRLKKPAAVDDIGTFCDHSECSDFPPLNSENFLSKNFRFLTGLLCCIAIAGDPIE
jgi:hypothetical protein